MNNDVIKIEEFIWSKIEKENRIGLLNGLSGIGILYKYLTGLDSQKYSDKLTFVIERIESIISEEETLPSICSGLAGYGYLLVHLKDTISIDESYFMDIDEILLDFLKSQSNNFDYDFLHGSLGIGLYFLERHSVTNSDYTKKIITEFYTNLLQNIQNNFENVIRQKEIDGTNSLYFGLAHGIAGTLNSIYLSSKYIDFDHKLLNTSILKLLDVLEQNELKNDSFIYPNYSDLDNNQIIKSRLAWCQGDLGIGNSLMNSGLLLKNNDLYIKGQKVISRTFDLDTNKGGINDVGICHGISGVILQNWLYYEKSNITNKSSINIWIEYLKTQTNNYSDFKAFHKGKYIDEINLLEGATGIALTKLTIENKIDKNWISCLNLI